MTTRKANKSRLVQVLQKHIDRSMPEHSGRCMVAEAIKDAYEGSTRVHVDMQTIRYTDEKGVRRTYLTPASAQSALVRFDAGDPVRPFQFYLSSIMHISKMIRSQDRKPKGSAVNAARARVGGRPVPMLGNTTRRRFGIRNLRINNLGEIVQSGVIDEETR